MCVRPMDNEVFEYVFGEEDLGDAFGPRCQSFGPQPPATSSRSGITIAGILPDRFTLIVCAVICIAFNIAIWRI